MTPKTANLFAPMHVPPAEEHVEALVDTPATRIERIVSRGHASPPGFWYDQAEHEWVAVLQGAARLELRDPEEALELGPGDHILISAHRPHRVAWTAPDEETVWLAVFYRRPGPATTTGAKLTRSTSRMAPRSNRPSTSS